ncbi:glycosyltransferase family 39 protein [Nitrosopumilus sp. S6]
MLQIFQKKTVIPITLLIICGISIRVVFTLWNLPSQAPDTIVFFIEAFNYANNDYSGFNSRFLWPFVLSIFFRLFDFQNFIEYINIMRIISIGLSVITIPIIYKISREFVAKKYALFASSIFVFEPNIIENSTWGITESLFLFLALVSIFFVLKYNNKFTILSFVFAGLAFDTRINGIVLIILILVMYSVKIKSIKRPFLFLLLGLLIFTFLTIPHYYAGSDQAPIISRASGTIEQNDNNQINPSLYQIAKIFYSEKQLDSNSDDFQKVGIEEIYLFALIKEFYHIFLIAIPIFIFLVPLGIIIILRNRKWNEMVLFCGIIISIIIAIPQYTLSSEIRNLLLLIPLASIISAIGINYLDNKKNVGNLIMILSIASLIIFSIFILNTKISDIESIQERENFGKFVSENFEGKISGDLLYHIQTNILELSNIPIVHNQGKVIQTDYSFFALISENHLIDYLTQNEISYIVIDDKIDNRYVIFEDVFHNEQKYSYLTKVYDSKSDYNTLKVKIFKVNSEIFDKDNSE